MTLRATNQQRGFLKADRIDASYLPPQDTPSPLLLARRRLAEKGVDGDSQLSGLKHPPKKQAPSFFEEVGAPRVSNQKDGKSLRQSALDVAESYFKKNIKGDA